jgi:dolichol-phosphate mannosyltransferase
MDRRQALVIIPTYNEAGNIATIISRILASAPVDVLVVDDASPDGTGQIVDLLAATEPRVTAIHRSGKQGLGAAYLAGFAHGKASGYSFLIEMDADGSHPPAALPAMISALAEDTTGRIGGVIGSRWVRGGSVVDWPKSREFISRGGSLYARIMLGIKVRDVTAGFRVYRTDALEALDLATLESRGYCFQIDMTRRMLRAGFDFVEVPIEFRERVIGESKMSRAIIIEAMLMTTKWGFTRVFRPSVKRRSMTATELR